ncbi:MAG: endolytic transglycosylase MltG [Candidatus Cloacimonetes bacterium]|nr:endolytic transglycosylase MltG [Candidatus Cloacimonadota bacterium]
MKILSFVLILVVLIFIIQGVYLFFQPITLRNMVIEIKEGETASDIAEKLYEKGVITSKAWFHFYTTIAGYTNRLSYGKYLFHGSYSLTEAVQKIISGEVYLRKITIPEGLSIWRTCRRLSHFGFGDYNKFKQIANDSTFAKKVTGFSIPNLEGFLYPETYYFPEDVTEEYIITTMVRRFFLSTSNLDFAPDEKLDFYDTIILASIIEKEAKFDDEKPLIASVYLNRIEYGMKLQADPTVAYILEQLGRTRQKIYYRDLEIDSPFNTYKYSGLPPRPICSPGLSSLEAVLNPVESDYFFFFADGDKGRHIFSQTYSQHLSQQRELKRKNAG